MGLNAKFFLLSAVFAAFARLASASGFISDDVFVSHGSGMRSLLQAKTSCPVNFEFMNYTIITNRCKGPRYPADQCCGAFKDFACPYAAEINDMTNDCASTMFSYINLYGKYPPGLFSSECREGKLGLACNAAAPQSSQDDSSSSPGNMNQSLISAVFLVCVAVLGVLFS
ncbi:GPI-anchored protein LLG1-like [Curcuma longa]|uniref:GPI-anchored protein LLG1-like n=1 Tax=Curcuma longa TaxID=136217 RepID=UPI003D9F4D1E